MSIISSPISANAPSRQAGLWQRASETLKPVPVTSPDEWGAANRIYPPSSGKPGPRDPWLTPYMIPFVRAIAARQHKRVVMVCGAQMAKTDNLLDEAGRRADQEPVPMLYVGPNKQFLTEQFEPRVMSLLDETASLRDKLARGKRMTKTRKVIAGVPFRLAHAGSSAALKSDPFGLTFTDEYDELLANVKGQGDPLGLIEARGETYADYCNAITSTPTIATIDVEKDPMTGLEFWKWAKPEDIESPIWKLWQEGTRYHWTWPCPHCGGHFIPRFRNLRWDKGASPHQARQHAWIDCPHCGAEIEDHHKQEMNARGLYVAPGQVVSPAGTVTGEPALSSTISFWVSGLASPFKSFGERAEAFLQAEASGDRDRIQTAINARFGEPFSVGGGDQPANEEIMALRLPYKLGDVPDGVQLLICSVDVQKNRLIFVIRGWGPRASSWLIDRGELWGETTQAQVWSDLAKLLEHPYGNRSIRLTFIDSGFRPGKPSVVPENMVYEFCRRHRQRVFATKGVDTMTQPLVRTSLEVTPAGTRYKYGLDLIRLNTDWWKTWVHDRVRWPIDQPGAWHLPEDIDEAYCASILSEARSRKASGRPMWIRKSRDNHYLDCEAMNAAAGYLLGVQRLQEPDPEPPEPKQQRYSEPWIPKLDNWIPLDRW